MTSRRETKQVPLTSKKKLKQVSSAANQTIAKQFKNSLNDDNKYRRKSVDFNLPKKSVNIYRNMCETEQQDTIENGALPHQLPDSQEKKYFGENRSQVIGWANKRKPSDKPKVVEISCDRDAYLKLRNKAKIRPDRPNPDNEPGISKHYWGLPDDKSGLIKEI
ncbi:23404_t:CDS:1 [Entrophospora sp. SA101]|nr:9383_t:CDS:1 [Entrophospora sp. SA101]CAJ0746426.1 4306_t:CDS:1 [Entrophospora sp. SA101]CAJ0758631.1 10512_t:CDS:1 [Entrophospora sp. SA101]CAJ0760305.1 12499_t:CDS:1 [Entrophospora sp. SA101]CAJ0764615.1 7156_t:CDS:1 [Entrophospora sp. SA101]